MRKKEFLKKSEARIIIYLSNVRNSLKHGGAISDQLQIDYIYVMKLIKEMFNKGWIKTHQYEQTSYFEITKNAPLEKARATITDDQSKLYSQIRGHEQ